MSNNVMIGNNICTCKGKASNCLDGCTFKSAYTFVHFLSKADFIETNVGRMSKVNEESKTFDLICTGIKVFSENDICDILVSSKGRVNKKVEFNLINGLNCTQLISEYARKVNATSAIAKELRDKVDGLLRHKIVANPIKPGSQCLVYSDESKKLSCREGVIEYLKWTVSKETEQMVCDIVFRIDNKKSLSTSYVHKKIEDYGKSWFLCDMRDYIESKKCTPDIVEMSSEGIVKPIHIIGDNIELILDRCYLYKVEKGRLTIVSTVEESGVLRKTNELDAIDKTKEMKLLKDNMQYIMLHRRYISPYGLIDSREVNMSKGGSNK